MIKRPEIKPKLLLVDDEEMFLEFLSRRLINYQYDVTTCLSGEKALEMTRDYDFDVVILDVLMPGMDGIETLREIKKIKPLIEVIMLTGHASRESGIEGIKLGAHDYLSKPCNTEDLIAKINDAYGRKIEHEKRIGTMSERL
ncbi:MAG: response regulator [Dissulfuribacterales bacterium]